MITLTIVDDEQKSIDYLAKLIAGEFNEEIQLIGASTDPFEGLELTKTLQPNIVLLDIKLPKISGFELAQKLTNIPVLPVFLTGHVDKVAEALKLDHSIYLLKPVRSIDIRNMILIYEKIAKAQQNAENPSVGSDESTMKSIQASSYLDDSLVNNDSIVINTTSKVHILWLNDVYYFEANGSYTHIHYSNNQVVLSSRPISYFDNLLGNNPLFFRSHRSIIINLNKIVNIQKGKYTDQVILLNSSMVQCSVINRKELRKRLSCLK